MHDCLVVSATKIKQACLLAYPHNQIPAPLHDTVATGVPQTPCCHIDGLGQGDVSLKVGDMGLKCVCHIGEEQDSTQIFSLSVWAYNLPFPVDIVLTTTMTLDSEGTAPRK